MRVDCAEGGEFLLNVNERLISDNAEGSDYGILSRMSAIARQVAIE
jgi:hypothetical protein